MESIGSCMHRLAHNSLSHYETEICAGIEPVNIGTELVGRGGGSVGSLLFLLHVA